MTTTSARPRNAATAAPAASYTLSDAARARLENELADLHAERAARATETGSLCGDAADIAEFAARDMRLEQLDERIAQVRAVLSEASTVRGATPPPAVDATAVMPGCRLTVLIDGSDDVEQVVLGDRAERAAGTGVVTLSSPLGRALIGAHPGDTVEYRAPAGTLRATVVDLCG